VHTKQASCLTQLRNRLPNQPGNNSICTHSLPDKDVVNHRTATEDDAQSNEDARDDGRRRVELDERVQDYS